MKHNYDAMKEEHLSISLRTLCFTSSFRYFNQHLRLRIRSRPSAQRPLRMRAEKRGAAQVLNPVCHLKRHFKHRQTHHTWSSGHKIFVAWQFHVSSLIALCSVHLNEKRALGAFLHTRRVLMSFLWHMWNMSICTREFLLCSSLHENISSSALVRMKEKSLFGARFWPRARPCGRTRKAGGMTRASVKLLTTFLACFIEIHNFFRYVLQLLQPQLNRCALDDIYSVDI